MAADPCGPRRCHALAAARSKPGSMGEPACTPGTVERWLAAVGSLRIMALACGYAVGGHGPDRPLSDELRTLCGLAADSNDPIDVRVGVPRLRRDPYPYRIPLRD